MATLFWRPILQTTMPIQRIPQPSDMWALRVATDWKGGTPSKFSISLLPLSHHPKASQVTHLPSKPNIDTKNIMLPQRNYQPWDVWDLRAATAWKGGTPEKNYELLSNSAVPKVSPSYFYAPKDGDYFQKNHWTLGIVGPQGSYGL